MQNCTQCKLLVRDKDQPHILRCLAKGLSHKLKSILNGTPDCEDFEPKD